MVATNRVGHVLVDTYRIERLIAEGGMGSVYEAKHLRLPKRFAVKFLNLSLVNNAQAQARFRREAEIIASLDHANIVGLLDYNLTEDGVPFIVLEYLDGEHLGKRIARGRLSVDEALAVLGPVAAALAMAHERDIVHRDLKPENIVLVRGGEVVKVVDFGIAKIHDGQELTAANMILGTVPYMAPEQLFGAAITPRTDQFALGAILYEMLSSEMAFGAGESVTEVAARVAHHQPPFVAGVPAAVNEVMLQAMAKRPDARFPSVKAFFEALVAAARRTEPVEPAVDLPPPEGEGLPELPGEATVITMAPTGPPPAERAGLGDDENVGASAPSSSVAVHGLDEAQGAGDSTVLMAQSQPAEGAALASNRPTMQLDRSAIAPAPAREGLRETAQVSASSVSSRAEDTTLEREVTDSVRVPEGAPSLARSATLIYVVLGIVLAVGAAFGAWAVFIRKAL